MLMSTLKAGGGRGVGEGKTTFGLNPSSNSGDEEYLCRAIAWLSWKPTGEIGENPAGEPTLAWLPQWGRGYGAAIIALMVACSSAAAASCSCRSFALSFLPFRSSDAIFLACSLAAHSAHDMPSGFI